MAKSISNTAMLCNLVLVFCFLLLISAAESRSSNVVLDHPKASSSAPSCDAVFGVRSGDTCFRIAQLFRLTTEFFDSINPNLNFDALFVAQWLCVDGSV